MKWHENQYAWISQQTPDEAILRHRSKTRAVLSELALDDFLQIDQRPCFVVDTSLEPSSRQDLKISYCNSALLDLPGLLDAVQGAPNPAISRPTFSRAHSNFWQWILAEKTDSVAGSSCLFRGFIWSNCVVVQNRWLVISGSSLAHLHRAEKFSRSDSETSNHFLDDDHAGIVAVPTPELEAPPLTYPSPVQEKLPEELELSPEKQQTAVFDVTNSQFTSLTPHLEYALSVDWASSAVGKMTEWPGELRMAFNLVMSDPQAAVIFWGPEKTMIYNEIYPLLVQGSHPCMGQPALIALPRYRDQLVAGFTEVEKTGQALIWEDVLFFHSRDENENVEGYFTLKFLPLIDSTGAVIGIHQTIQESTRRIIAERRINTFVDMGASMMKARGLPDLWRLVLESLYKNDKDIPFALLYTLRDQTASLKGIINVPEGHAAAVESMNITEQDIGFSPLFREVSQSRKVLLVHVADGSLPEPLVRDIESKAFGDAIRSVAIAPITTGDQVLGFFVVGCSPRRPFDDGAVNFITTTSRMLATGMASTVLFEEEVGRRNALIEKAAHVQADLSEKLSEHQRRLDLQEMRFQQLAERVGVAILITDANGLYTFRNQRWFDLFPEAKDQDMIQNAWLEVVEDEDVEVCEEAWKKIRVDKVQTRFELRLKRKFTADEISGDQTQEVNEHQYNMWVLADAYPTLRQDGSVNEIICVITDISRQKLSEVWQQKRTHDALEGKRQLENFIDTTSHEMRNPLSAIIHSADGLLSAVHQAVETYPTINDIPVDRRALLEVILDSAQTITQCSAYMRRIVDDVLTMSKLESGLLVIAPVDVQPIVEIRQVLKMFAAEAEDADVSLGEVQIGDGFNKRSADWIKLDPVRVSQVVINLITNAIKFTKFQDDRRVLVTIDLSEQEPATNSHGVQFFPIGDAWQDPTGHEGWGDGKSVYFICSVKDTGKGLSPKESDLLFNRFSQVSPRTHIKYGGNGLGLWISKRLAELQGGAIGFSSQPGNGSIFSFYIKARRSLGIVRRSSSLSLTKAPPKNDLPELMKLLSQSKLKDDKKPVPRPLPQEQLSVLVVEDNLVNQKVLAKQLRKLGCNVAIANHGLECLHYIESTTFWSHQSPESQHLSLILLDWEMPVCDGLTCVKKIRDLQREGKILAHVPVIGVTANARPQQVGQAITAGMDDVVSKPFRVVDLMERMRGLLERLEKRG